MELKTSTKQITATEVQLQVEFSAAELKEPLARLTTQYAAKLELPGFRKGKVPLHLVKTRFKDNLRAEALEQTLPAVIEQAIKQEKLETYGPPVFNQSQDDVATFAAESAIKFTVNFALPPTAKLKGLNSVLLLDHVVTIPNTAVQAALEDATLSYTKLTAVQTSAERKDLLKATLVFNDERYRSYNLSEHSFMFVTSGGGARPQYLNDLESTILSMRSGEERTLNVAFKTAPAEEQQTPSLNNITTEVKIALHSVKRRAELVWNEALLEKLGVKTELEYRTQLRTQLEKQGQELLKQLQLQEILLSLHASGKFRIPELAVEHYLQHEWARYREYLLQHLGQEQQHAKLMKELPQQPSAQWAETARPKAERGVCHTLIFQELKQLYPPVVTEDLLTNRLQRLAKQLGRPESDVPALKLELEQNKQLTELKQDLEQTLVWDAVRKHCKHKRGKSVTLAELETLLRTAQQNA